MDHDVGFMFGSRPRFVLRRSGVEVAMNVGIVDVRNVIATKCAGIM